MVVFLETCFFPYGRYKTFNIVMVSVDGKELADKLLDISSLSTTG